MVELLQLLSHERGSGWSTVIYYLCNEGYQALAIKTVHYEPCRMNVNKSVKSYTLRTPQLWPLSLEANIPHIKVINRQVHDSFRLSPSAIEPSSSPNLLDK